MKCLLLPSVIASPWNTIPEIKVTDFNGNGREHLKASSQNSKKTTLHSIQKNSKNGQVVKITLYLNDAKVIKRFGPHPERGVKIPGTLKKVTVGFRWSLPHRDYIPDDDVLVQPCMRLQCLKKGKWLISVEASYAEKAQKYLLDNCM